MHSPADAPSGAQNTPHDTFVMATVSQPIPFSTSEHDGQLSPQSSSSVSVVDSALSDHDASSVASSPGSSCHQSSYRSAQDVSIFTAHQPDCLEKRCMD